MNPCKVRSRLQPEVSGVDLVKSNGKLHPINEGAKEFQGMNQGTNLIAVPFWDDRLFGGVLTNPVVTGLNRRSA